MEQGIRQRCGLTTLLFNIFFAAVIMWPTRVSILTKDIMDALLHLKHKTGEATAGKPVLATSFWGMVYANDAEVVSQSPEKLRKMDVIVVVCAAFGLTVSEAKTEIIRLRTKGMPESTAIFSVEAAGQVYNQTNGFVYLGDLSIMVDRRICNVSWCSFRRYTLEPYDRPSALKTDTKSRCTRDKAVRLRHVESAHVPL